MHNVYVKYIQLLLGKLVLFHAYDQVAFRVYLYWAQDTIEGISFARDLLVTVNPVSFPLMFLCFEIEIGFLNLPQLMFQVVFKQGIFNLQQSITMNSTLWVNLMCLSAKISLKSPTALRVIWILVGNCPTRVTSISRPDLLSWHRPHTSLEALFAIMVDINHICFCIFIHAIKQIKGELCVPHEE